MAPGQLTQSTMSQDTNMLTAKNLERMIALEDKLRAEYQVQLDAKSAEIESLIKEKEEQKAVIAKQLEQIKALSVEATGNKKIVQQNRELHQRCENLQEDIATQKKRTKALQKDLSEERVEVKALKQFDPARMKKNLDASKKKLAEKTTAADLLQKSLSKSRAEKAELERKVKELEGKLAELEPAEEVENSEETEKAAA
jgi:septal ring factor EnvC (AmiA/AmiB activator)